MAYQINCKLTRKEVIDGVEYPLFKVEISSTSHPFYTGKVTLVDSAGRVDKFMTRYGKHMENRKNKFLLLYIKLRTPELFFCYQIVTISIKMGKFKNSGFQHIFGLGSMDNETEIIPIIADGDDRDLKNTEVPDVLPILPLRNTVLFPGVVLPITVGREASLELIRDVNRGSKLLGTVAQRDYTVDHPKTSDIFEIGTVAEILKVLEMPDGSTSVIIQGKRRYRIAGFVSETPYFKARVESLNDILPENDNEFNAIVGSLKDLSIKIAQFTANIPPEATFAVKNIENSSFLINFICSNTDIKVEDKQKLLEIESLKDRGIQAISFLVKKFRCWN
jgi:ATP-dependent Lon protease